MADHEPPYVIADKGYDSDELVRHVEKRGSTAVIPSRSGRTTPRRLLKRQYRRRNHVERFVSRIKHLRRVATRYEKTARNFLGFIQVAALFSWLPNVNTSQCVPGRSFERGVSGAIRILANSATPLAS